jgi:hypothetical protein
MSPSTPPSTPPRSIRMLVASGAVAALLAPLVAGTAAAQAAPASHAERPAARAVPTRGRIVLDGRLDEAAWAGASPVTAFTQLDPDEGRPASERSEVYLVYDAEALYVGARLHDSGPVSKRLVRRDALVNDSDWFIVALDSYHDHLTSYRFSVNPAGVRRDEAFTSGGNRAGTATTGGAVIERGGQADQTWDPVWQAAATVTDSGWVAELRIPFAQLRFARAAGQTWGLQLERRIARKQEQALFAFVPKTQPAGVALYGHLEGLEGIQAPRPLELLPYTSGRLLRRPAVAQNAAVAFPNPFRDRADATAGIGADVKYRLTSNFTLDATFNPDFGQVEQDPAVVNLTAFEIRFDERRPFFVEGAEIMRFGTSVQGNPEGGPPQLLYSRRVGRAPQLAMPREAVYADVPEATTILGAAKLTGRTRNGWSVGVLQAVTQEETGRLVDANRVRGQSVVEPLANYVAGRLRRDLRGGRTTLGGMLTAVNRRLEAGAATDLLRSSAYSGGLDFRAETADRVWSLFGSFSPSLVRGSPAAIAATQRSSAHFFQRPDADHLDYDPTATSLFGYRAQIDAGKRAGSWTWNTAVIATSPGYEINDLGFLLNADRILLDPNVTYEQNRPGRLFRRWSLRFGPDNDFNFGGDLIRSIAMWTFQSQLQNFWTNSVRFNWIAPVMSDRLTRGGPLTRLPAGWLAGFDVGTDPRKRYTATGGVTYTRDRGGMAQTTATLQAAVRPASNWNVQVGPTLNRVYLPAQYVTTVVDSTAAATYGSRYVFAGLDQTTLGIDTRLNVTFTPALSLELYAQPFVAANDFGALKELRAPRTFDFSEYGKDVGTVTREPGARDLVDPDGPGPGRPFRVEDRDFNLNSLRGNAVLRWEWRPGSTMFLVWQQERAGRLGALDAEREGREVGSFDVRTDVGDIFGVRPTNVLVFKVSYWLNP